MSCFGGRPKVPPDLRRDQRVVTFLTTAEHRALEGLAQEGKVSVSRACRDLMLLGMGLRDPALETPPDLETDQ